jgi:Transposase DDE domain
VALRFDAIELRRPVGAGVGGGGEPAKTVALWVVDVSEVDPPEGAEPEHWRLLTTHQVTTPAEAHQIVEWYRRRWIIEQVFRSLKSHGMDIEASQMVEAACFTKLAVIALIAAVGAMQLVLARDGTTGQPVTDAVEPSDMAVLRELNTGLQGAAPRSCGTRSMRPRLRGTPGSPHGWAGGPATPRADTSRRGRRPCTAA